MGWVGVWRSSFGKKALPTSVPILNDACGVLCRASHARSNPDPPIPHPWPSSGFRRSRSMWCFPPYLRSPFCNRSTQFYCRVVLTWRGVCRSGVWQPCSWALPVTHPISRCVMFHPFFSPWPVDHPEVRESKGLSLQVGECSSKAYRILCLRQVSVFAGEPLPSVGGWLSPLRNPALSSVTLVIELGLDSGCCQFVLGIPSEMLLCAQSIVTQPFSFFNLRSPFSIRKALL